MISIQFEMGDEPYIFRDALVLPEDHTYSDADIETMKQFRYDTWYAIVTAPPEEVIE